MDTNQLPGGGEPLPEDQVAGVVGAQGADASDTVFVQDDGSVIVGDVEPLEGKQDGEGVADKVGEGTKVVAPPTDDDDDDGEGAGDARLRTDAELAGAANEAEREAIRARRRQERKDAKERKRTAMARHQSELAARDQLIAELTDRIAAVERSNSGADLARIDAMIEQKKRDVATLRTVIADATRVGNGEAAAEATERMTEAMIAGRDLVNYRQRIARTNAAPTAPQLDVRIVSAASAWMNDNQWYDPTGQDPDSKQVLVLDARLSEEGYNPLTPAYWQELDRRVKAALPHRARSARRSADDDDDEGAGGEESRQRGGQQGAGYNPARQGKPNKSVVAGSGADGLRADGGANAPKKGFLLSRERVQALKDAGLWDDPKARTAAIKSYRDYDAQQAASASSSR